MALIKCVECGQEYSDKAEACPKCACPTTAQITKENVEEVKPDVEPEVTERNQLKPRENIGVDRKFLVGITAIGITAIGITAIGIVAIGIVATGITAVVLIINSSRETIYRTQAAAMAACNKWAQNQYESEELYVYAKENNLPLDEVDYAVRKSTLYITDFICYKNLGYVEATGGITHYEYFSNWDWWGLGNANAAERAEARVRELRDELGIKPKRIQIYRPYKPGFDSESCAISGFTTQLRIDPSRSYYCPMETLSSDLEGKGGDNGRFDGIELYVRKNNLTESDIFIVWKEGDYTSEPVKVFPYYRAKRYAY